MADPNEPGGKAAKHPVNLTLPVFVAPAVGAALNTLRSFPLPIACWRLDDIRFDFDSSFVRPEGSSELRELSHLVSDHPGAPLSVFGHADPVGDDDYNKQLSGRRSAAIFALLTRKTAIWEDLHTHPFGGDHWGTRQLQLMLATVPSGGAPLYDGPIDGVEGAKTTAAVKAFQTDQGLAADGVPGPKTRGALFATYMDLICTDDSGSPFVVAPEAFLGEGADPDGKAQFQGCSEFNPVRMFSKQENATLASDKLARNRENALNRRVVVFLFRPGTKVTPEQWPCPRAKEGVADCKKQFWPDAARRRTFADTRREYSDTQDTFACLFYDRLARRSPCERIFVVGAGGLAIFTVVSDGTRTPLPDITVLVEYPDGTRHEHITDANGQIKIAGKAGEVFTAVDIFSAAGAGGLGRMPSDKTNA